MSNNTAGVYNLRVLVCGKAGVGKSSLINSIFGCNVCTVVDPGSKYGSIAPCTTELGEPIKTIINGNIMITIYDSPGLQDGTGNEERYLQDMYDKCRDVDLVIYCIDMTITRYANPEIRSAESLTERLGSELWQRCVLVMTKANRVWVRAGSDKFVYHKNLHQNILQEFRTHLISCGVSSGVANNIPAVSAGRCVLGAGPQDEERYVWYVSDRSSKNKRPADFLAELWITLYETASKCSTASRIKFVAATAHQQVQASNQKSASTLQELLQNEIRLLQDSKGDNAVKMIAEECIKGVPRASILSPSVIQLDKNQIDRLARPNRQFKGRKRRDVIISLCIIGATVVILVIYLITIEVKI